MVEKDTAVVQETLKKIKFPFWAKISDKVDWKVAIKIGVVGALAYAIGSGASHYMNRPDSLVSGMWCVMAALIVMQAHLGGTYNEAYTRFLGIFIGSALGGLFTVLLGSSPFSLGVSILCTIVLCSLANIRDSIRIACMSVAVVMILWNLRPEVSPWVFAFFRIIDSTLGILIAVLVAHTLWPIQITDTMRINLALIMRRIQEFSVLTIRPEVTDDATKKLAQQLTDEIDDLLYNTRLSLQEAKAELIMEPGKLGIWQLLLDDTEQLYLHLISLQKIHQHNPRKIFDQSLSTEVDHLIESLNSSLINLSEALATAQLSEPSTALLQSKERLQLELSCFRNTHTTRKFNLKDVEHFFVFFYTLGAIVDNIQDIEQELSDLLRSSQ